MEELLSLQGKKKYNKVPKPETPVRVMPEIWCHQCKMKKSEVICCDNFFKKNKQGRCNGKYCDNCMQRHYQTCIDDLRDLKEWACFKCTEKCVCASCKRERGDNVPVKKRRKRKNRSSDDSLDNTPSSPLDFDLSIKKHKVENVSYERPKTRSSVSKQANKVEEAPRRMSQIDVLAETASQLIACGMLESSEMDKKESSEIASAAIREDSPCYDSADSYSQDEFCPNCKESVNKLKKQVSDLQNELAMLKDLMNTYAKSDSSAMQVLSTPVRRNSYPLANVPQSFLPPAFSSPLAPSIHEHEESPNLECKKENIEVENSFASSFCDSSFSDFTAINSKMYHSPTYSLSSLDVLSRVITTHNEALPSPFYRDHHSL